MAQHPPDCGRDIPEAFYIGGPPEQLDGEGAGEEQCSRRHAARIRHIPVGLNLLLRGELASRRFPGSPPPFCAYFVKFTRGTVSAPGVVTSKYVRAVLPITFAVSTWGKRRM